MVDQGVRVGEGVDGGGGAVSEGEGADGTVVCGCEELRRGRAGVQGNVAE